MKREISIERTYAYPVERVWRALTDPTLLAQWLMSNDFEPRLGHKFQFRAKPMPGWSGVTDCEVIALDEPHKLAYTWESGDLSTVVTWTLEPTESGTLVRFTHTGFTGMSGIATSVILGSGWNKMMDKGLPAVLAGENFASDCHTA
jgi:uncharacterized protein YndB with AHSA1/START domain